MSDVDPLMVSAGIIGSVLAGLGFALVVLAAFRARARGVRPVWPFVLSALMPLVAGAGAMIVDWWAMGRMLSWYGAALMAANFMQTGLAGFGLLMAGIGAADALMAVGLWQLAARGEDEA